MRCDAQTPLRRGHGRLSVSAPAKKLARKCQAMLGLALGASRGRASGGYGEPKFLFCSMNSRTAAGFSRPCNEKRALCHRSQKLISFRSPALSLAAPPPKGRRQSQACIDPGDLCWRRFEPRQGDAGIDRRGRRRARQKGGGRRQIQGQNLFGARHSRASGAYGASACSSSARAPKRAKKPPRARIMARPSGRRIF